MSTTLSEIEEKTGAERTRSNILAPKLRFKEFEGGWQLKSLGELLEFKNGINASKEQYGHGIKFINVLDILNNDFITYDSILGSVNVDENVAAKYPVNYGDILFQRSSETREEVGTACVYLDQDKTAVFGGFVIRGRKIGEYNPIFLNKLLKTDTSRNEITSKSGGSTRYNVGQETLSSVALNFPTLPEQQKIASFLSAVDEKIQQLTRKKELLEQYKKGVMQHLFSGELRFKPALSKVEGVDDGECFPDWEEKKLGDVAEIIGGGTPDTLVPEYWDGDIQWYTPTEIFERFVEKSKRMISKSGLANSSAKLLPVGTILFTSRATIAELSFAKEECSTNQGFQSLIVNQKNIPEFVFYWIKNNKKSFIRKSQGSTFLEINKTEMQKIKIHIPSLKEQQKIATYLSAIDTKIESVANQITQTQTFKKGLLQQMFV